MTIFDLEEILEDGVSCETINEIFLRLLELLLEPQVVDLPEGSALRPVAFLEVVDGGSIAAKLKDA
jgi:hypothetical protein